MAEFDKLVKAMAESTDRFRQLIVLPRETQQAIDRIVAQHQAIKRQIDEMVAPLHRLGERIAAAVPKIEIPDLKFSPPQIAPLLGEWELPEIEPSLVYGRIEELEAEVKELKQRVADLEGPPPLSDEDDDRPFPTGPYL